MSQIYVTPVGGAQVPDPAIGGMLPASGRRVDYSQYWQRRIDEGVVTVSGSPSAINANTLHQPVSFATMADFNNAGGSAAYGVGSVWIAGGLYWCDGVGISPVGALTPSGGDDSAAFLAMAASYGNVKLGPGTFKLNTPIILAASTPAIKNLQHGIQITGEGPGVTIVDTSGMNQALLQVHDTWTITGITNANPCVVTVSTTIPETGGTTNGTGNWTTGEARVVNGTPIYIQVPSSSRAVDNLSAALNTMEALSGIAEIQLYIKKLTNTTFALYQDSALTVPVDTTNTAIWGSFGASQNVTEYGQTWATGASWKMRRYYGNYQYTPAIRLVGKMNGATDRYQTFGVKVEGVSFTNTSALITSNQELQGICIAVEDNITAAGGAAGDTSTSESNIFRNVFFYGYDADVLLDDCTNTSFEAVSFEGGNNHAVFAGYNMDLVKFHNCRFGNEGFIAGIPNQQVIKLAPVYIAPANITPPATSQTNNVKFETCWFMQCHDVIGDVLPDQVIFDNCYFEKARRVTTRAGSHLIATGNHFTEFPFQANFLNSETVFSEFTHQVFVGNEGRASAPKFGWTAVTHNSATEIGASRLDWRGNNLVSNAPTTNKQDKGHIRYNMYDGTSANARKFICIYDDVASGETRSGRGSYTFVGADQTSGDDRTIILTSYTEGTNAPARYFTVVPEQYNTYIITLTNPTQFWDPSSAIDANNGNGRSWNEQHNSGSDRRCFKSKPLVFILTQDATGGRTVSFTTGYVTTGLVASGTAGQKTRLEFRWDGSKWRLVAANAWS